MADSHYISKSLLRNWEHPSGCLRYYDFSDGRIKRSSAKKMYVSETQFPDDVEKWLGRVIESPLGDYVARCKRAIVAQPSEPRMPDPLPRERKALTLAVVLQGVRTGFALDNGDTMLVDTVRRGDDVFDMVVMGLDHVSDLYVAQSFDERLYFSSVGVAVWPLVGGLALFLPLAPWMFVMRVPKAVLADSVKEALGLRGMPTALSAGLRGERVVIPPLRRDADHKLVAGAVREARASAQKICDWYLKLNAKIGADIGNAWRPAPALIAKLEAERLAAGGKPEGKT
jgi:hypothetical protein